MSVTWLTTTAILRRERFAAVFTIRFLDLPFHFILVNQPRKRNSLSVGPVKKKNTSTGKYIQRPRHHPVCVCVFAIANGLVGVRDFALHSSLREAFTFTCCSAFDRLAPRFWFECIQCFGVRISEVLQTNNTIILSVIGLFVNAMDLNYIRSYRWYIRLW